MLANIFNMVLYYQRLPVSAKSRLAAAKRKYLFFWSHATAAATIRGFGYYSTPISICGRPF